MESLFDLLSSLKLCHTGEVADVDFADTTLKSRRVSG